MSKKIKKQKINTEDVISIIVAQEIINEGFIDIMEGLRHAAITKKHDHLKKLYNKFQKHD